MISGKKFCYLEASFTTSNVCDGETVNFTSTSTILTGSIATYEWDFENDGTVEFTSTTGDDATQNYPDPGA